MTLTLFSDYSLRILMYAALRGGAQFSVDEVASAYGLSRHHVAKAVNHLTQRGYLTARRGRGGGLCLGQAAESIRIGELVRETESGAPLIECLMSPPTLARLSKPVRSSGRCARRGKLSSRCWMATRSLILPNARRLCGKSSR